MATVRERVEAGAAWLDRRDPGWEGRIKLGHLSLESSCNCVLGQLAMDYFPASQRGRGDIWHRICDRFGVRTGKRGFGRPVHSDVSLGFNVAGPDAGPKAWRTLDREWRRVILERLNQKYG